MKMTKRIPYIKLNLCTYLFLGYNIFFQLAKGADLPLYVEFIPFAPPNLHLQTTQVPNAFYIPGLNAGVTYQFTLTPVLANSVSLAEGPIPISISVFRAPANCSGNKSVTITLQYSIGGVLTNIGSQTQTITVPNAGNIVPTFAFNGITATQNYTLGVGDFVVLSITANTTRLCLVNEFPLGGTDTDASRVVLQTGPLITMAKTSQIVSDPVNGTVNPKSIPGATVRYTLTVSNDPLASAGGDNNIITDLIPANTTYTFGDNTITLDGISQTDADDQPTDNTDFGVTTPNTITIDLGTINPGDNHTITYDVIVN